MNSFTNVNITITYRMEEHFRSQESLITNINFRDNIIETLMSVLSELIRLNNLSTLVLLFRVILDIFLNDIFAHISIFFLTLRIKDIVFTFIF